MGIRIGIGFSKDVDPQKAAQEAASEALTKLGIRTANLAIIFSSVHYDPQKTLPVIGQIMGQARIVGCSTAGVILSNSIETRGIAILAMQSEEVQFGIGTVTNINNQDMKQAGNILARDCIVDFGQHRCNIFLFFPDGLIKDNSQFLKGMQEIFGNLFPIVGAGSSDDFHFTEIFQISRKKALRNSSVGVMLGGNVQVGVGGGHGWRPLGKPRLIDKADNHIIRTIDKKRASSLYEEYFGESLETLKSSLQTKMSILYPLGIYMEESNQYLLRNVVDILPDGSIVCQGDVPEQSEVHIMIGNKESCQQAAVEAAQEAKIGLLGKEPKLVIVIESMSRLKLLGRMATEEIQKIKEIFNPNVPIFGMYSYGEIYPFQTVDKIKKAHLQNESIVVLTIG